MTVAVRRHPEGRYGLPPCLPGVGLGEHHDAPLTRAELCMAVVVRGGHASDDLIGHIFRGSLLSGTCP